MSNIKLKYKNYRDLQMAQEKEQRDWAKYDQKMLGSFYATNDLLRKAEKLMNEKSYESAYCRLMHLLELQSYLTSEKSPDPVHFKALIGNDFKKAVDLVEKCRQDLIALYERKDKAEIPSITSVETTESSAQLCFTTETSSEADQDFTSTATLFTALKSGEKILILDVRSEAAFQQSHIDEKFMRMPIDIINVPRFTGGISADQLSTILSPDKLDVWKKRASYNKIIVVGQDANDKSVDVLKDILLKFDKETYSKGVIAVLEDGFSAWAEAYLDEDPHRENSCIIELRDVNYDLDDLNLSDVDECLGNGDAPSKLTVSKTIPFIDRSSKIQASKKYAERETLNKKDKEIVDVLETEKELSLYHKQQEGLGKENEELKADDMNITRYNEIDEKYVAQKTKIEENERIIRNKKTTDLEEASIQHHDENKLKDENEKKNHGIAPYSLESQEIPKKLPSEITPKTPARPKTPHVNRTNKPKPPPSIMSEPIIGKSPGLTGLKNLGNTCYMNSILQCISNNPDLYEYFTSEAYKYDLNQNQRTQGEVANKVASVIQTLWHGQQKAYAARQFKDAMGSIKAEYKTSEQQDSHEFLTFLMDWLHNDLNKEDSSIPEVIEDNSDAKRAWLKFNSKNKSRIANLFYGLQKSTVKCLTCGKESSTFEPFSNLSLSIPNGDTVTLERCINEYLQGESISGWRCPQCKKEQPAERKTEICRLPIILVIHLKRFSFLEVHSSKKTTLVKFPIDNLKLPSTDQSRKFSLYGVSNHYGTMEAGHYTAFCKNFQYNRWYRFDDHEVSEIQPNRVETAAAYILFYTSNMPYNAMS